jgi:hypothetical protein
MADKKISELPLLNSVSGSSIIVPIVHDGTTVKLNLSQLAHYSSQWSAKTGSANTFTGNQTINGNLSVSGKITVNELVAVYETASVVFSSGSNIFGDAVNDIHQFTGSVDINGTLILNGSAVGLAQINAFTQSVESQLSKVYNATSSLQQFTASQDNRNFIISQYTSSTDAHIVGIAAFTSSQLAVNLGNAIYTASVDSHIVGISTYTSSVRDTLARIHQATASIQSTTASINSFTSSTNAHIVGISTYTSSNESWKDGVRGELNGIEAWTASLDNIYATDAQLYQLYQSTRSIELHSGSMVGITNMLMAYTSSNETWKTGIRGEISGIEAWTASLDNTYATDAQLYQLYQATRSIELHSGSMIGLTNGLMAFTSSLRPEINGIETYTASLKAAAIVSSSQQITNYYKFAETASANTFYGTQTVTGNIVGQADVQANKFVFTDAVINTNVGGQKIVATSGNILYLYSGTSGLYINNQANDTTIAQFTNAGQLTIGGPGNDQNLVFGGTNSSIYWGSGGPARMYYNVGDIKISSNGAADVLTVKNIGGISVSGGITGSLMATNGVVSGSQQIKDYFTFAQTSSANTFYGNQTITGSLNVNNGITGSFKGNLAGVADYASTIVVVNTGTTTDTTLYPTFTINPILAQYTSLYSHASSSFFFNGVTRRLHMEGLVVSGSNNIVEISGSFNVSGSTIQFGNNTLIGNTQLSGSIEVSGSSNFRNSLFIVSGSSFFTGSHTVIGNTTMSGSINVASGSGFYRAGNKLFNYGQWCSLETQSGSANTAYAVKMETKNDGSEGVYVANNGSGFPTRLTVENTGLYNIQFSLQLNTTATETCDFSVWYAMTGSNIANSNTDFSINKTAGGGNGVAALNFLTPITANDYIELYWSKNTANGELQYKTPQSTPTRPATPSAIVTITQVA